MQRLIALEVGTMFMNRLTVGPSHAAGVRARGLMGRGSAAG